MNDTTDAPPVDVEASTAEAAHAAAAKTRKKTRTKKKTPATKSETAADTPAPGGPEVAEPAHDDSDGELPAETETEAPTKKKRSPRKRSKKKTAKSAEPAPDSETANDAEAVVETLAARAPEQPAAEESASELVQTEQGEVDEAEEEAEPAIVGDAFDDAEGVEAPPPGPMKATGGKKSTSRKTETEHETPPPASVEVVVNYAAGDDCRIAFLEDGRLEEFDAEPTDRVSRVGNIYLGRVTNIQSQIQAAFVDFGLDEAGFLHVSDLHPRYFPGGEKDSERVGFKTPRRHRPPIQECLKRGQQIAVQVLKEGVGTKGPSLTSYLSVPGRYLVMMPEMDKVGVSRKVEDDDLRRRMRQTLDQLELPDGFGFILRTAGLDRNKTELKRDLAYLQRLWKDMERRRKAGKAPRLLYAESDLLLRTLRDRLSTDVKRIVIDDEHALRRAAQYLKIVSPRSRVSVERYTGRTPIFHAFGVETQLDLMHATEVPLPSGGRLIIEQTEALVAIDVNSGKSRSARDAETNALETNLEAVDEICRQLRLRDLGGLVISDLIDMRPAANRKRVEQRFRDRLKRDRAKSTILPISEFGILEMTRQRMRGSYEQQHFQQCPACSGRGLIPKADSVAARSLHALAVLIEHDKVRRAELVVGPRIAGALLSTRRAALNRLERRSGKSIDVRVSDSIPPTRFSLYAYDESGADIDISRLPQLKSKPQTEPLEDTEIAAEPGEEWSADPKLEAEQRRAAEAAEAERLEAEEARKLSEDLPGAGADEPPAEEGEGGAAKKKRKRRRRKKKAEGEPAPADAATNADESPERAAAAETPEAEPDAAAETTESTEGSEAEGEGGTKRKRRRRKRRKKPAEGSEAPDAEAAPSTDGDGPTGDVPADMPMPHEEKSKEQDANAVDAGEPSTGEEAESKPATKKRRRRSLYSAARRALAPSERGKGPQE